MSDGGTALSARQRAELDARIDGDLERAQARVMALSARFDDIVATAAADPPDDEHDPEGATIAYERAQVDALLERARAQAGALAQARMRLRDGTMATCVRCGLGIGFDRLLARPATRRCVDCAGRRSAHA